MIKEYFLKNYNFLIINIKIYKNLLIIYFKIPIFIPKIYYKYLLFYLYKLIPKSINVKSYNKYYKILILKYQL